jgi:hypothetical protein
MSRVAVLSSVLLAATAAGCGGGEEERASGEWCRTTKNIDYVIEQHNSAPDLDAAGEWVDEAPEEIRPSIERAAAHYRRYPVDPNVPEYVQTRREILEFLDERCPKPCTRLAC